MFILIFSQRYSQTIILFVTVKPHLSVMSATPHLQSLRHILQSTAAPNTTKVPLDRTCSSLPPANALAAAGPCRAVGAPRGSAEGGCRLPASDPRDRALKRKPMVCRTAGGERGEGLEVGDLCSYYIGSG